MKKEMFNERSDRWLSIFKGIIVFMFWANILAGLILGFAFAGDMGFGGFLLFLVSGAAAAFLTLVIDMLVLQFLSNVQFIRQRMEENPAPEPKAAAPVSAPKPAAAPAPAPKPAAAPAPAAEKKPPEANAIVPERMPDGKIRCPKCGTIQNGNRTICFNCPQKFTVEV